MKLHRRGAVLLSMMLGLACVHARDFRAPAQRITDDTAYAEHKRVRADVGLLGPDAYTLILASSVRVAAVRDHLDFGLNLAHGAIGVASIQAKWTAVDTRWYALGGRAAFTYMSPRTFWFLPKGARVALGSFNLISGPLEIWNSFPFTRFFQFDLGFGYRHAEMWGELSPEDSFANLQGAKRSVYMSPYLRFYAGGRVAIWGGMRLPLYSRVAVVAEAESEIEPGVIVGGRSVEWRQRSVVDSMVAEFAAETRFGNTTHMRLSVLFGAFRPLERLLVVPSLLFYWRFR